MDENFEKGKQILKSIKMLEGVLKTSPNSAQRARVKKDIEKLKKQLEKLYPAGNIKELENSINEDAVIPPDEEDNLDEFETLKKIEIEKISPFKDDKEINLAIGILKYLEERIWGIISDQHTKLDFSSAGERDALFRKLDQCNRSYKIFHQTIDDIEKTKSSEYMSQLHYMRVKQGRLFLYDLNEFIKSAKNFVATLISDAEFGGTMIKNPDEVIIYADYESYSTFANMQIIEALKFMKNFLNEASQVIKVPDVKKY